jgi:hypothetical protein
VNVDFRCTETQRAHSLCVGRSTLYVTDYVIEGYKDRIVLVGDAAAIAQGQAVKRCSLVERVSSPGGVVVVHTARCFWESWLGVLVQHLAELNRNRFEGEVGNESVVDMGIYTVRGRLEAGVERHPLVHHQLRSHLGRQDDHRLTFFSLERASSARQ